MDILGFVKLPESGSWWVGITDKEAESVVKTSSKKVQLWFGQLKCPVLPHGCHSCCALGSSLTQVLYLVVLSVSLKYRLKRSVSKWENCLACGVIVVLQ